MGLLRLGSCVHVRTACGAETHASPGRSRTAQACTGVDPGSSDVSLVLRGQAAPTEVGAQGSRVNFMSRVTDRPLFPQPAVVTDDDGRKRGKDKNSNPSAAARHRRSLVGVAACRSFLTFESRAFDCSRRSFDARVGRVFLRGFGSINACCTMRSSRASASARFCSSDRNRCASITMMPASVMRRPAIRSRRARAVGHSSVHFANIAAQLDGVGHLVDVLAAGARRAHGAKLDQLVRNGERRGNRERHARLIERQVVATARGCALDRRAPSRRESRAAPPEW